MKLIAIIFELNLNISHQTIKHIKSKIKILKISNLTIQPSILINQKFILSKILMSNKKLVVNTINNKQKKINFTISEIVKDQRTT
jgi:hypothetical protein